MKQSYRDDDKTSLLWAIVLTALLTGLCLWFANNADRLFAQ